MYQVIYLSNLFRPYQQSSVSVETQLLKKVVHIPSQSGLENILIRFKISVNVIYCPSWSALMIPFRCFLFSSLQQTAPPCLTTAVSQLFTSDLVSCTVASHSGTRAQPSICLQMDNAPTGLMGKITCLGISFFFFPPSVFLWSSHLLLTKKKKKKKMDLFSKTFTCVCNPLQGSQRSRILIVSFLETGPPPVPAGYRWHSPETRHSDV